MDNFHILGYPVIGYKENKDDDDIITNAEPSRTKLYVCSVYTSSGILTAYSIWIAPRRSRHVMPRRSSRAN